MKRNTKSNAKESETYQKIQCVISNHCNFPKLRVDG